MTVKTQESIGDFRRFKQLKSSIDEHDEILRLALIEACEDKQIPDGVRDEIIEKGVNRFVIDKDGNIKSMSVWSDVNEYINSYQGSSLKNKKSPIELADEREAKKQELYDLLCHYSKIGDMKSYRAARKEYAQL